MFGPTRTRGNVERTSPTAPVKIVVPRGVENSLSRPVGDKSRGKERDCGGGGGKTGWRKEGGVHPRYNFTVSQRAAFLTPPRGRRRAATAAAAAGTRDSATGARDPSRAAA